MRIIFKSFFDFILFFIGLRKTAIIAGDSMLPSLKEGDIVFFKKYKKNKSILKNRQIVIFNHPLKNKNLIKRINSVNQNNIEVLGDNIEFSEDSNKFGLINNEKIIGIVTSKLIIPKLKNFLIQKNRSISLNPK
ncbi:nickel-type superoxide dismutase maturation protease [Prochlorococcus sp. MIT 9311]|uniref:nickel-type superoxide dismutase maturation protease n=1 Tax=Prochlorococcus sp. MIT 9311 TaxID=3082528 RepID=UPI0039B5481E